MDCSIAHASGAVTALECRKRARTQDVIWIEQLVCKRQALGLAEIIAVSATGFSGSARLKAQKHGIRLKTYRELEEPSFLQDFAHGFLLLHDVKRATLRGIEWEVDGSADQLEGLDINEALEAEGRNLALLRDTRTGEAVTVGQMLDRALSSISPLTRGTTPERRRYRFPPQTFTVAPIQHRVYVRAVSVVMDVELTAQTMHNPHLARYSENPGEVVHIGSADVTTTDGKRRRVQFVVQTSEQTPRDAGSMRKSM